MNGATLTLIDMSDVELLFFRNKEASATTQSIRALTSDQDAKGSSPAGTIMHFHNMFSTKLKQYISSGWYIAGTKRYDHYHQERAFTHNHLGQ